MRDEYSCAELTQRAPFQTNVVLTDEYGKGRDETVHCGSLSDQAANG